MIKQHKIFYGIFLFIMIVSLVTSCGSITSVTNPPIPTTTKLTSSSLADSTTSMSFLLTDHRLSTDCNGFFHCLTPTNVSGKIYYSGILVGETSGYSVGPIVGDVTDPSQATSFSLSELFDFDFSDALGIDGNIQCCEGSPYPDDDDAIAVRIESYFGYIDVSFTLTASDDVNADLIGEHTIRTVYADIDGTEYIKGDFLYQVGEGDFRWCTVSEGCTHATRPSQPLQYETVVNYNGSDNGLGNQIIPTFSVNLDEDSQIQLTESQILNNSWLFTIDFHMGNGVVFTEDLTTKSSVVEMIQIFQLSAEPGNQDNGFTASLTAVSSPL